MLLCLCRKGDGGFGSILMEIQTYPDNSDRGIYGSSIHIAIGIVYSDHTLCINFHRVYSNNYVLSFSSPRVYEKSWEIYSWYKWKIKGFI